ncbi:hypothetical protein [Rhodobacter sp. NSM]|uniref:hypothetical protein n=1 Tax=Rhodobacter sp. NSM TaxID=3457501 RepID=UPI003FD613F2
MNDMTTAELVRLDQIDDYDTSFSARSWRNDDWTKTLAVTLKRTGKLDPVLLWRDPDSPEGKLLIVDGHYRIAAYRSLKRAEAVAQIVQGSREQVLLQAAHSHLRGKLPLSAREQANFTWKLVREVGRSISKAELVKLTGMGTTTISRMRARWTELLQKAQDDGEDEPDITGDWHRDMKDKPVGEPDALKDEERTKAVQELARAVRNLTDRRKHKVLAQDGSIVLEAMSVALGDETVRALHDFAFSSDEELLTDWKAIEVAHTGPEMPF